MQRGSGTVRQVRKRLQAEGHSIPERAIRGGMERGEIPVYAAPGSWPRIYVQDVLAWWRSQRVGPSRDTEQHVAERLAHEAGG